jgi:hypothetical protein
LNWILNGQDGFDPNRIENLAQSLERLDVTLVAPPQLRVAYLTAWPASEGKVAFRGDVYGLDGTGFVLGQPLPVGEKSASGERFVLKPIPRQVASLEEAEYEGFFWFGKRSTRKTSSEEEKTTKLGIKKTRSTSLFSRDDDPKKVKKKPVKKLTATSKKKATVADSKKTPVKATAKVASTSTKKDVKPETPAAKKTEDLCKLDKDGKLPKDCKVEAVAKPIAKPAEKPEATVSATN